MTSPVQVGPLLRQMIDEGRVSDPATPRGRLLATAARLFREKGYNRTTMRELAAEVGILSGSIFHHFESKDEILFGVMHEVVLAMDDALATALAEATTTRDKILAIIHTELAFIHGKTGDATAVLIYEWRALSEKRQRQVLKVRKNYFKLWEEVFAQAHAEGLTLVEPEYLSQLLHGAMAWTTYWFKQGGKLSQDELANRVLALAIKE